MSQLTLHPWAGISPEALWPLLRTQARKYAQGDHGSLPVEVMEDLLASMLYTLGQAPEGGTLEQRLALGQERLRQKVRHAKWLLVRVRASALPPGNSSYQDTMQGLPGFFARYDVLFAAHQVPVDIDYQLYLPQFDGEGVDAFTAYLEALLAEQRFCGRFSKDALYRLWAAASPDWQGLHINLYEPVVAGAVGQALLGEDPHGLLLRPEAQGLLHETLRRLSPGALEAAMCGAAEELSETLGLSDASTVAYLRQSAQALLPRVAMALKMGSLAEVFPMEKRESGTEAAFVDGPRLPNADMRRLVLALRACGSMEEKLALLRGEVHSLRDLGDLLSGCFWGVEVDAVLGLLTGAEAEALAALYPGEDAPDWVEGLRKSLA